MDTIYALNGGVTRAITRTLDHPPASWDWRKALSIAKRSPTTLDIVEHIILTTHANSWFSCACGGLDPRIPRETGRKDGHNGRPFDHTLTILGLQFYGYVCDAHYGLALIVLERIEIREKELLKELGYI